MVLKLFVPSLLGSFYVLAANAAESLGPCSGDLLVRSFSGPLHWGVPLLLYRLQGLSVSTGLWLLIQKGTVLFTLPADVACDNG